jgi:hypothetical protein
MAAWVGGWGKGAADYAECARLAKQNQWIAVPVRFGFDAQGIGDGNNTIALGYKPLIVQADDSNSLIDVCLRIALKYSDFSEVAPTIAIRISLFTSCRNSLRLWRFFSLIIGIGIIFFCSVGIFKK